LRTASLLGRKGTLALRKGRLDEAVLSFQEQKVLQPDDDSTKLRLERALRLRAEKLLERRKAAAAMNDASSALELVPDDANARMVLAEAYLAMGKHELAAEEYQRLLDDKPADKRARRGLDAAKAAGAGKPIKPPPKKKKR
jgi:tetratricopeptide (TPR) repeat protein